MTPVNIEDVRNFLRESFGLNSEDIETMLNSIKTSLNREFVNAQKGLAENDMTILWKAAHSIKGALLNAGVESWAEKAKNIELSGKAGESLDYEGLFRELKEGILDIL